MLATSRCGHSHTTGKLAERATGCGASRDVGHISGFLLVDGSGRIGTIVLNQVAPFAAPPVGALATLLADDGVTVSLGQT